SGRRSTGTWSINRPAERGSGPSPASPNPARRDRAAHPSQSLAAHPPFPPPLQDLHERAAAQLLQREAGGQRLLLGDGAAVERAEEVVEEALTGRGVIEDVADQRGLPRLFDEVAQALG